MKTWWQTFSQTVRLTQRLTSLFFLSTPHCDIFPGVVWTRAPFSTGGGRGGPVQHGVKRKQRPLSRRKYHNGILNNASWLGGGFHTLTHMENTQVPAYCFNKLSEVFNYSSFYCIWYHQKRQTSSHVTEGCHWVCFGLIQSAAAVCEHAYCTITA